MDFPRHVHKCGDSKIVRADEFDQALRDGWSEHPVCTEPFVTADPSFVYPSGPVYGRPEQPRLPDPPPPFKTFNPDPPPPEMERFNNFMPPNVNHFVPAEEYFEPPKKKPGRPKKGA